MKYDATKVASVPGVSLSISFRPNLNNAGTWLNRLRGQPGDSFYYHPATRRVDGYTDLGSLPGSPQSHGYEINNLGYIAGTAYFSTVYLEGTRDAFVVSPSGVMTLLPHLNHGAHGLAISENNIIAGSSFNNPGGTIRRAVYWTEENGTWGINDLGVVGSRTDSVASDVNSAGQVLGSSYNDLGNGNIADLVNFIWHPSQSIVILPDGFDPVSINDRGEVLGTNSQIWTPEAGVQQLTVDYIGFLNNQGQMVGVDDGKAVLWENGQTIVLNDLLMDDSIDLTNAIAISDSGNILATTSRDFFFLQPAAVPEPSSAILLLIGLAVIGLWRNPSANRRHRAK